MKYPDRYSGFFLFFLGLAVLVEALHLGLKVGKVMGPGFFPFLGGIILISLSTFLILQSYTAQQSPGEKKSFWLSEAGWKRVLLTLVALGAYPIVIDRLGFVLSTLLFLFFLFRGVARMRWRAVFTGGIVSAFSAFLIFELWLKAGLPKGPFGF